MVKKVQFTLPAEDDLPISITAWLPEKSAPAPILIFLPGLKGFVNWGGNPYFCEHVAAAGYTVLGVDYSRNGVENFGSEITRIDLAEGNSVSRQVGECNLLLSALRQEKIPELAGNSVKIDAAQVFVLGHSVGGGTSLLFAAQHPEIKGVIASASISRLNLWPAEVLAQWEHDGRLNVPNARTGANFFLGRKFLSDIQKWGDTGILDAAAKLKCPLLIIHGDQDSTVPLAAAREIQAGAKNTKAELFIVAGGDHNYGAVHPFKGTTPQFEKTLQKTIEWLNEHH